MALASTLPPPFHFRARPALQPALGPRAAQKDLHKLKEKFKNGVAELVKQKLNRNRVHIPKIARDDVEFKEWGIACAASHRPLQSGGFGGGEGSPVFPTICELSSIDSKIQ